MNGFQCLGCGGALLFGVGLIGRGTPGMSPAEEGARGYRVALVTEPTAVDAQWDGALWRGVAALELHHFMGARPEHFPRVQAKLAYSDAAIYLIFQVDDRYVRAVARQHQDDVCRDSCVEFFFTPGRGVADGYFNLEMNCGGTMLFHYQPAPGKKRVPIAAEDLDQIDVVHSMPKIVEPEVAQPTRWTVAYRLPLKIVEKYFPAAWAQPAPGVIWRANLYKCADATSHPHWLTWSPVRFPRPNFHRPEQFGELLFDGQELK